MITIQDFIDKDLKITWTLLKIGFDRTGIFTNQLDGQDIIEYAFNRLVEGDETQDVILLASSRKNNIDEIRELLDNLASNENANYNIEFRKWRAVYISKNLPSKQREFFDGLLELGDLWVTFDFPDDSPHIFQGRDNSMTPSEYYRQENYDKLLKRHEVWLEKEIEFIRITT